jgi:F1F0 ATPase subunit 2
MTWLTATVAGAGLGLLFFGGLWLTIQQLVRKQRRGGLLGVSCLVRLTLMALVFYGLSREGAGTILAGLCGWWLARWCLIRQVGGRLHEW